jgi:hypothetical protein
MKNLRTILTSVLFAAAVLGIASPAIAQPSKNTPSYYLLGGNSEQAAWMSTEVESNNGISSVWILVFLFEPQVVEGVQFQSLWFLVETNCSNGTNRITRVDMASPEGKIVGSTPNEDQFSTPVPTSPSGTTLTLLCHPENSTAVLMTQEEISRLLDQLMAEKKVIPPTA